MKRIIIVAAFAVITLHAQPSTIDQLKKKIQEINQLAWSIPEAKPLLKEYNQVHKQLMEMERSTGIDRVKRAYIRTDKEICLSEKKAIAPLQEKRLSLVIAAQKTNQASSLSDLTKENRLQEINALDQEIYSIEKPYFQKKVANEKYKSSHIQELGGEKYRELRKKIEQLDRKIYLLITEIKPQADTLYAQLAELLTQETCNLAQGQDMMENLLYIG